MEKKNNKISIIVSVIILLIILALGVYYFLPNNSTSKADDYFKLTVMSDDISEEKAAQYQAQLTALQQSIEANPGFVNNWFDVGIIKKLVGDYRGAEAAWIKAGEIRPANSTSFGNLADLYANFLHEYDKAEEAYKVAIRNSAGEPKNLLFYRQYAEFVLYRLENVDKAESILLESAEVNYSSSEPFIMLGNFYRDKEDTAKAVENYEKALELDPEDNLTRDELEKLR